LGSHHNRGISEAVLEQRAKRVLHGLESRAENLTIVELEKWAPSHPGWNVLYFHARGATRDSGSDYDQFIDRWRECMMRHCISNWQNCVALLDSGYDAVGAHWMPPHRIFGGNFWWATSDYLATVEHLSERDRVKVSGIAALASRYEAEVWIGHGKRIPKTQDLHKTQLPKCSFDASPFIGTP